jgi:hypothetical protein
VSGLTGDARPPGGGRSSDEELRQQQRELQQRALDAQDLRRLMDRNSTQARDLDQVYQMLQRLTSSRRYDNPEGIASLKRAVDLLHQIELDLSRDLARALQNDKYFYAEDNEVPASYKKLVEEYYKALAKGKR